MKILNRIDTKMKPFSTLQITIFDIEEELSAITFTVVQIRPTGIIPRRAEIVVNCMKTFCWTLVENIITLGSVSFKTWHWYYRDRECLQFHHIGISYFRLKKRLVEILLDIKKWSYNLSEFTCYTVGLFLKPNCWRFFQRSLGGRARSEFLLK